MLFASSCMLMKDEDDEVKMFAFFFKREEFILFKTRYSLLTFLASIAQLQLAKHSFLPTLQTWNSLLLAYLERFP